MSEEHDVVNVESSSPTMRLSRRRVLETGAFITAGLTAAGLLQRSVAGQDATPTADETAVGDATPESQSEAANAQFPTATPLGDPIPPEYTADETNWPSENLNLQSTRLVTGSNISTSTVGEIGLGWSLPVNISAPFGALVANPVIANGIIYQQDAASNVYALDKETGDQLWANAYNQQVPSGGPNGVALGYGMAYYTLGGPADVIAVKADTGEEVWRTNIRGPRHEGITMAPIVYDSTVYVSTIPGSVEAFYSGGQRGVIFALDASTGQVLWYFDTVVDNLWNNARVNSGGGLWHPPSFDAEGNIYVGIGNAAPYPGTTEFPNSTSRLGDNNYANSLIRINPDTAGIDWFINVKPHDLFDLDNQLSPVIANVSINGTDTTVVFTSGKHGIVVAANAETGEELWRTPVGKHQNDDLQEVPEGESVEVFPGTLGGVETPFAYAEGVVYLPVLNIGTWYFPDSIDAAKLDLFSGTGEVVALDAATGQQLWSTEVPSPPYGGITIANDILFTAGLDAIVRGYNIADGTQVWTWEAQAGINSPLAISGDYLYVPAGGPIIPSADTKGDPTALAPQLYALKIGGEQTAATPAAEATPAVEEGAATPAASVDGGQALTMVDPFNFEPKAFTIAANTDVVVNITNTGALQHDFVIDALSIKTDLLNGGDSTTVTINAAAGTYEYYCSVTGHREAGMTGTLTVE